jgi:hypothetical protein
MLRALLIAAASVSTLAACVAMDYGPMNNERPYGYSETKRPDGSYIVRVVHPDAALALKFWDQRAAELCGSTQYVKNIYSATRPTVHYSYYGGMPGVPSLEGMLTCSTPAAAAAAAS